MMRDDSITYEELLLNTSRNTIRSRLSSKPISSALSRRPAITVLGGKDFHLKALLMAWICPPLPKIVPELCAKK
jgi:hypothetical protein